MYWNQVVLNVLNIRFLVITQPLPNGYCPLVSLGGRSSERIPIMNYVHRRSSSRHPWLSGDLFERPVQTLLISCRTIRTSKFQTYVYSCIKIRKHDIIHFLSFSNAHILGYNKYPPFICVWDMDFCYVNFRSMFSDTVHRKAVRTVQGSGFRHVRSRTNPYARVPVRLLLW